MREGERALLEIKPAYAFMHKGWKADIPAGLRREDTVKADVEVRAGVLGACMAVEAPSHVAGLVCSCTSLNAPQPETLRSW